MLLEPEQGSLKARQDHKRPMKRSLMPISTITTTLPISTRRVTQEATWVDIRPIQEEAFIIPTSPQPCMRLEASPFPWPQFFRKTRRLQRRTRSQMKTLGWDWGLTMFGKTGVVQASLGSSQNRQLAGKALTRNIRKVAQMSRQKTTTRVTKERMFPSNTGARYDIYVSELMSNHLLSYFKHIRFFLEKSIIELLNQ